LFRNPQKSTKPTLLNVTQTSLKRAQSGLGKTCALQWPLGASKPSMGSADHTSAKPIEQLAFRAAIEAGIRLLQKAYTFLWVGMFWDRAVTLAKRADYDDR
jgi:hypothetical protein